MLLTFINLTQTQVAVAFILIFSLVVFAGYKVLKRERGLTQVFWLLGIFSLPPIFAIIYLVKTYLFDGSFKSSPR